MWRGLARCGPFLLIAASSLFALGMDISVLHGILRTRWGIPGDVETFRQSAALLLHQFKGHAWTEATYLPYPPPFLLLTVPLSWLPPLTGYIAWVMAGLGVLVLAARAVHQPWGAIGLGLTAAPALNCMTMGQTGFFISGCLLLSLGLVETSPILAGIAAGCIVIKPQFGLLLPVCYLAAGKWRAFMAAAATFLLLCLLPALLFGGHVWSMAFTHSTTGAHNLLTSHWPQGYQYTLVTIFILCRSLGASFTASMAVQGLASLAAVIACAALWRHPALRGSQVRLAATLCLVPFATPYADIYDLSALTIALAGYAALSGWRAMAPVTLLCAVTSIYVFFSIGWFVPGALLLVLILVLIWPFKGRAQQRMAWGQPGLCQE